MHKKNMHRYFFTYILFHYLRGAFLLVPRASEWENLFSLNERSQKCMCFINDIYAEFSCQRVGKLVFTQLTQPKMHVFY